MLELKNINVSHGQAKAIWDANISIRPGELVSIVGPNGAGKTTLINTIAGIHRATSGQLIIDGKDITQMPAHQFCDLGIALVPESRRLFVNMTVRENLMMGAYRSGARLERLRHFEEVCEMFPALVPKLDNPAGSLSGGQQQMVAIGRALMSMPKYLLLDEPSLGLSPLIVHEMFSIISKIHANGVAIFLVEQNVSMAMQVATRAYVLEEGRIVKEGTPENLMNDPHVQRAYLGI